MTAAAHQSASASGVRLGLERFTERRAIALGFIVTTSDTRMRPSENQRVDFEDVRFGYANAVVGEQVSERTLEADDSCWWSRSTACASRQVAATLHMP